MKIRLLIGIIALFPQIANSQVSLKPLRDVLAKPENEVEVGYPFIRCAAFYDGSIGYGGANWPKDVLTSFEKARVEYTLAAALVRVAHAEQIGRGIAKFEPQIQQAGKEMQMISTFYYDRMTSNFAATGEIFDPLLTGDAEMCREMAPAVSSALSNYKGEAP